MEERRRGGKGKEDRAHFVGSLQTPFTPPSFPFLLELRYLRLWRKRWVSDLLLATKKKICCEGGFVRSKEAKGLQLTSFSSLLPLLSSFVSHRSSSSRSLLRLVLSTGHRRITRYLAQKLVSSQTCWESERTTLLRTLAKSTLEVREIDAFVEPFWMLSC